MTGKNKCKILKNIRREIAKQNDIDLVTEECKYKGDCLGTCPKCEAEVRYLESELEKRRALGKKVAVAGLVTTLAATSVACDFPSRNNLDGLLPATQEQVLEGDIAYIPESEKEETYQVTAGIIAAPPIYENTPNASDYFKAEDKLEYLKQFTRDEIRSVWYYHETNIEGDVFSLEDDAFTVHEFSVEYDEDDIPILITVLETYEVLSGDPT